MKPSLAFVRQLGACAALAVAAAASASSNPNAGVLAGCETCDGATFKLSYGGSPRPDTDAATETYRVTYTIGTGGVGAVLSKARGLDAAALKLAPTISAARLVTATGGVGNWELVAGGVSAAGCNGAGAGFQCVRWTGAGAGAVLGGDIELVFDLTVPNGTLFTAADAGHVKARFVDASGRKVGALVSSAISLQAPPPADPPAPPASTVPVSDPPPRTAIPEPAGLTLVLAGLAAATARRWRRAR